MFCRPKIPPATCRHCGKVIKDYGGYWKNVEEGLNLSDVWDDLSPVRHKRNKNRTSNELPLALPRRIVEIAGEKGGLVVDPFAGAGTMLVAAREADMQFLACDREESCCAVIARRLGDGGRAKTEAHSKVGDRTRRGSDPLRARSGSTALTAVGDPLATRIRRHPREQVAGAAQYGGDVTGDD